MNHPEGPQCRSVRHGGECGRRDVMDATKERWQKKLMTCATMRCSHHSVTRLDADDVVARCCRSLCVRHATSLLCHARAMTACACDVYDTTANANQVVLPWISLIQGRTCDMPWIKNYSGHLSLNNTCSGHDEWLPWTNGCSGRVCPE